MKKPDRGRVGGGEGYIAALGERSAEPLTRGGEEWESRLSRKPHLKVIPLRMCVKGKGGYFARAQKKKKSIRELTEK